MWQIRLGRELPRYLLSAAATCGLLASLRLLVAPPQPRTPAPLRAPAAPDRAAEGYAVLFARRYLTWEARRPLSVDQSLQGFTGAGMEPDAGEVLPASGEQQRRMGGSRAGAGGRGR